MAGMKFLVILHGMVTRTFRRSSLATASYLRAVISGRITILPQFIHVEVYPFLPSGVQFWSASCLVINHLDPQLYSICEHPNHPDVWMANKYIKMQARSGKNSPKRTEKWCWRLLGLFSSLFLFTSSSAYSWVENPNRVSVAFLDMRTQVSNLRARRNRATHWKPWASVDATQNNQRLRNSADRTTKSLLGTLPQLHKQHVHPLVTSWHLEHSQWQNH